MLATIRDDTRNMLNMQHIDPNSKSEWVIRFNSFWGTADTGIHVVYTSGVIIGYKLESLSSIT